MNIQSFVDYGFSYGFQDLLGRFARVQSIGDFVFFRTILTYLRKQISDFGIELMGNMMTWVGGMALVLMTLWVLIQGFRIVTGRSRDSMMVLVTNMARPFFHGGAGGDGVDCVGYGDSRVRRVLDKCADQ